MHEMEVSMQHMHGQVVRALGAGNRLQPSARDSTRSNNVP